ncbi:MAG TPA: hypothetical protein VK184_09085 [Nostocaceae cyanobacterium]|nr:hypothetical protein [Nostocaceae cyanobacterium]
MSILDINTKSDLFVDLSTDEQEILTGGQMNNTTGRIPMGAAMTPGTTVVVPDMIYSVPNIPTMNVFGNIPTNSVSSPSPTA